MDDLPTQAKLIIGMVSAVSKPIGITVIPRRNGCFSFYIWYSHTSIVIDVEDATVTNRFAVCVNKAERFEFISTNGTAGFQRCIAQLSR